MDTTKAIAHLRNKIGRNKYATDFDKACINEVIRSFNLLDKDIVDKQNHYLRFYGYLYLNLMRKYNAKISDDIIQKEIHKVMDRDMRLLFQEITVTANMAELNEMIDVPEEDREKVMNEAKQWTQKEVMTEILASATEAFIKFGPELQAL